MSFPIPPNEDLRLKALFRYEILDTSAEQQYDDITAIASHICEAPIALISLLDDQRQWFKSRIGISAEETERDVAFCAHAIMQPDIFIIPDALLDDRFSNNPLVTDSPNIRFYAGAPLTTADGHNLGTLCVIDHQPRQLSSKQQEALAALSRQVISLMELRLTNKNQQQLLQEKINLIANLQEKVEYINKLEEFIPICSYCKKVHISRDAWQELDSYIHEHSSAKISHGICPTCAKKFFPDYSEEETN
ncbi:MAG TPA: GAF domain-containing protein [Pontiella sp.]